MACCSIQFGCGLIAETTTLPFVRKGQDQIHGGDNIKVTLAAVKSKGVFTHHHIGK